MPAVAAEIRWGTGFDNVVHFDPMPTSTDELPQGLDDVATWDDPAPGSRRVRNDAGVADAWERRTDYKLAGRARYFDRASLAGLQAFLRSAGRGNAFRFIPDRRYPSFYIGDCYLDSPYEDRRPQPEQSDGSKSIDMVIRQQAIDFGLAMRGLMFEYRPETDITEPSSMLASFTRATSATRIGRDGVLASAASGELRNRHFLGSVRTTLLELMSGNICLQSDNFGVTWVAIGTPTRVAAAHTASGVSLDLIGDDSAGAAEGYSQTIAFTGNAVKAISVFVRQGSSTSTFLQLLDTTAVADRLSATIGWSGGLPSVNAGVGTYLGYEVLTDGVFRLLFVTTSVTAANTNSLRIYPATDAAVSVAPTGTIYAGGVQAENNAYPTSYKGTSTIAVTRNADVITFPFVPVPQTKSWYFKFVEKGTLLGAGGAVVFQIGAAADTAPQFKVFMTGGVYNGYHHNGTTAVQSSLGAAPAYGDTVELLVTLSATGAVTISQSINGAAVTSGATSAANAFASAWSDDVLWLNSINGTMMGALAVRLIKAAPGVRTMAEMRAA